MEKLWPSYIGDGNVKWCTCFLKQAGSSSDDEKELLHDPAMPFLGIYPRKWTHMSTQKFAQWMFTEALFLVAQKVQRTQSLSTDEWINKAWYSHLMDCYLAIKWNEALIQATT